MCAATTSEKRGPSCWCWCWWCGTGATVAAAAGAGATVGATGAAAAGADASVLETATATVSAVCSLPEGLALTGGVPLLGSGGKFIGPSCGGGVGGVFFSTIGGGDRAAPVAEMPAPATWVGGTARPAEGTPLARPAPATPPCMPCRGELLLAVLLLLLLLLRGPAPPPPEPVRLGPPPAPPRLFLLLRYSSLRAPP